MPHIKKRYEAVEYGTFFRFENIENLHFYEVTGPKKHNLFLCFASNLPKTMFNNPVNSS